jgi:phospholipid transport system substrate-binding protein
MLLFSAPVQADEKDDVRDLLKTKIDTVVVLLQDKMVNKAHRNEQIVAIVTPIFDYQTMAKLSLGKKYWPKLSQEKQAAFSDLFTVRLQDSYLSKLDIYSDEKVHYGDPQAKGKTIHVPSTLISKGNSISMLYKFYHSAEGWKIYDVVIGGVSVIQTYRSQFSEVLNEGTIDDLLEKLKTDGVFVIPAPGEEKIRPVPK